MASTAPSSSSGSLAANAFLPFRSHPAAGGKAVGRPRTIALDRLGAMLKRSSGPDEAFELDMVLGGLVVDFCCADLCLAFDLAEAGADAQTKTKQLEAMGVRLVTLPAEAFTGWHKFAARSHASQVIGAEIHIARSRMEYIADWGCKAPF